MPAYTLSHTPRIRVVDGLFTDDELRHLAALGDRPDLLGARGIRTKHDSTGFSFEAPRDLDPLVGEVAARIEGWLGVEDAASGPLRFRRYAVGESHPLHLDTYTWGGATLVVTAMLCLVAPDEGGETRFPHAHPRPLALRQAPGRLLVWAGHLPDGRVDPASRHDGAPVVRGHKTTLTLFLYRQDPVVALPDGLDLSDLLDEA